MIEENYPPGNAELLTMIKNKAFDRETAKRLLAEIPDLNQPILDLNGYSTTYLFEAQTYNNVEAVRFLLENGADPNYCNMELTSFCALDALHYLWEETETQIPERLEIAKLFFDFGADPNLVVENETLYDHVLWEIFNDDFTPHYWEYLCNFFIILIAYGGGGGKSSCPRPKLLEPMDKTRLDEYSLKLFLCDDGYHLEGHLFDPDGMDIGTV